MTRPRRAIAPAVSGLLGAMLAVVLIAGFDWPPTATAVPLRLPKRSLADNKRELSSAQVRRFLVWARAYRACATSRGVALDEPSVGDDEVVIRGAGGAPVTLGQARRTLACSDRLGGPPKLAAFVVGRDRKLHLYEPRACLLPPVSEAS